MTLSQQRRPITDAALPTVATSHAGLLECIKMKSNTAPFLGHLSLPSELKATCGCGHRVGWGRSRCPPPPEMSAGQNCPAGWQDRGGRQRAEGPGPALETGRGKPRKKENITRQEPGPAPTLGASFRRPALGCLIRQPSATATCGHSNSSSLKRNKITSSVA